MISVIMPVYDNLSCIERAIKSVMGQTYRHFEFIVVSDGSPHDLRPYLNYDIQWYEREHLGVSAARNYGLRVSGGDLVTFIDSDDYLMPDALERMQRSYDETGYTVVGGVFRQDPSGRIVKSNCPASDEGLPCNDKILPKRGINRVISEYVNTNDRYFASHCWGRLYIKRVIDENSLTFNEGMSIGEDGEFNLRYMSKINRAYVLNHPVYCYQIHGKSSAIRNIDKLKHDIKYLDAAIPVPHSSKDFIEKVTSATVKYANREYADAVVPSTLSLKDVVLRKLQRNKVCICGADTVGKKLKKILNDELIKINYFTDNNPDIIGTKINGTPVISIENLPKKMICVISVVSIKNVVNAIDGREWYPGGIFLENTEQDYQTESCMISHNAFMKPDYTFLRSLDIIVTEKCSLKCESCSNLMQYFKHPKDYPVKNVLEWIDAAMGYADEVMEVRLLGGDAFMYKDLSVIVSHLAGIQNVKRIVIYTNGVMLPSVGWLQSLKTGKTIIHLTEYQGLSARFSALTAALNDLGIKYIIETPKYWIDCSSIKYHKRTEMASQNLFKGCVASNLTTLADGKLFRCPYAASLHMLGIKISDYANVLKWSEEKVLPRIGKQSVKDFLDELPLKCDGDVSCDYCTGRDLTKKIPVAIQSKTPLEILP